MSVSKPFIFDSLKNESFINIAHLFRTDIISIFAFNPDEYTINILADEMNCSSGCLAVPEQVHSNNVLWVETPGNYADVDGLVTSSFGPVLSLKVADCVPVYFYDSQKDIIGLIHIGWRGMVSDIVQNTIELMQNHGANMGNTHVYMGPAIGVCCYEVEVEVAQFFDNSTKRELNNHKWKVDLHKQINIKLLDSGVLSDNINFSSICTFESNQCHSYRRDGSEAGRMYAFMGIK